MKQHLLLCARAFAAVSIGLMCIDLYIDYRVETGMRLFRADRYAEALEELRVPASLGHWYSQSIVATILIQGLGVRREVGSGKDWLLRASRGPLAYSTYAEGLRYNGEDLIDGKNGVTEPILGKQLLEEASNAKR